MSVNTLIIQGRLTKDPINKNGNAHFSIAVDNYNGDTMYVDVVAFKQTAEYCFNFLRKGNMVLVEGSLSISKYQDKMYVSCVCKNINNLTNNKDKNNIDKIEEKQAKEETPVSIDNDIDISDDDLPF